jgi:hypothetical protein
MRESCKSSGASEARGSGAGERRRGDFQPGSARVGKWVNLTGGPGCQRDEGEEAGSGRRDLKGKTYFPRRRDRCAG